MTCRCRVIAVTRRECRDPAIPCIKPCQTMWHAYCSVCHQDSLLTEHSVAIDLDSYLGVHAKALGLREQRTEMLARNLANADTPGYKARDIDFRAALANVEGKSSSASLVATQTGHIGIADAALTPGSTEAFLKYRTPLAPSLDGNTVDAQLEQAAFADNAVRYQATLNFLSSKFRSLMTAITGE
jgi:flagellar basal-body rod protein FlgB